MEKNRKIIKEILESMLTETGEMSDKDIQKGGEFYEWAEELRSNLEKISKETGKFVIKQIRPFDKYNGPYAIVYFAPVIKMDHRVYATDKVWMPEDNLFYFENLKLIGSVELLSLSLNGDKKAVDEARKNYVEYSS